SEDSRVQDYLVINRRQLFARRYAGLYVQRQRGHHERPGRQTGDDGRPCGDDLAARNRRHVALCGGHLEFPVNRGWRVQNRRTYEKQAGTRDVPAYFLVSVGRSPNVERVSRPTFGDGLFTSR